MVRIVSESNESDETATSSSFRFFNEGPGIENYAPFPASAVNPTSGANLGSSSTDLTLEWEATDIDGDDLQYEVFFDTVNPPVTVIDDTTLTNVEVTVTSGETYFWRIITTDTENNSSQSAIFQFRIN